MESSDQPPTTHEAPSQEAKTLYRISRSESVPREEKEAIKQRVGAISNELDSLIKGRFSWILKHGSKSKSRPHEASGVHKGYSGVFSNQDGKESEVMFLDVFETDDPNAGSETSGWQNHRSIRFRDPDNPAHQISVYSSHSRKTVNLFSGVGESRIVSVDKGNLSVQMEDLNGEDPLTVAQRGLDFLKTANLKITESAPQSQTSSAV